LSPELTTLVIIAVSWVISSAICFGLVHAYFIGEYGSKGSLFKETHLGMAMVFGVGGPLGIVLAVALTKWVKHGWRWR
jgi:hypothetical protein